MEHHANLVPWQQLCQRTGATLRWFPSPTRAAWTCPRRRADQRAHQVVAFAHQSNVLGTVNPVAEIAALAHARGALVCPTPPSRCRTGRST